jgi:hypothetical protein
MDDLARAARAQYMRDYRRKRPEVIKKANENYWKKKSQSQQVEAHQEQGT